MMLLEYLVPSRARREVLRTLRSQRHALTVRELSRRAGVPYSNTHREVVRLRQLGLLRTELAGKSLLCSWDASHPAARKLTDLLTASAGGGENKSDQDGLYWNLKRWGAPLARKAPDSSPFSLEETLAQALVLARRDPDVAQVWPVVLARQRPRVDLNELESLARRLGQKRTLGFLLSLTGELLQDSSLTSYAKRFRDQRVRKPQDFFLLSRGKRARRLAEANTPRLAREWFFRMNTTLDAFQSHFNKFVGKA